MLEGRISWQGIVLDWPESRVEARREISSCHKASAFESGGASRLFYNEPARSARSSSVRESACCRSSMERSVITKAYLRTLRKTGNLHGRRATRSSAKSQLVQALLIKRCDLPLWGSSVNSERWPMRFASILTRLMPLVSVHWLKIATRCIHNPCKINALIPLPAGATLI